MGGFAFYGSYDDNNPAVEESLFEILANPRYTFEVPKFRTLVYIMKHFPHILTGIPEESILDQAASSGLSKALLIVQVAWFCTNCASRLHQGLPLSLLEISTAAHAFCTLVTYFVWWPKPINVAAPTLMRERAAREVYALLKCSDDEYDKALELAQNRVVGDPSTLPGTHGKIVLAAGALQHLLPNPERPPCSSGFNISGCMMVPGALTNQSFNDGKIVSLVIAILTSPMFYGIGHFLAWGDQFPTPLERLLWRVSSFAVTFSGLGVFLSATIDWLDDRHIISQSQCATLIAYMCLIIVPVVHVFASAFLHLESVIQLFFLDPAAYRLPSWSNYWPHLS
jgi:hypothetical protein